MNVSAIVMDSMQAGLACLAVGCALGAASSVFKQRKQIRTREKARALLPASIVADAQLHDALFALLDVPNPDLPSFERAARRIADMQQLYADITKARPSTVAPNLSKTASSIQASFNKYLQEYYRNSNVRVKYIKDDGGAEIDVAYAPVSLQLRASHVLVHTLIDALVHEIQMLVAEKLSAHAEGITLREQYDY